MITFVCPDCGVRWKVAPALCNTEIKRACPNCNPRKPTKD